MTQQPYRPPASPRPPMLPQQQPWPTPGQQGPWNQGQQPWGGGWQQTQRGAYPVPQQGYPPQQFQPPVRKSSPYGKILVALLVGIGAMIGVIWLLSTLTSPGSGTDTPTGEYQNEEYEAPPVDTDPPPLPQPNTRAKLDEWLENNAIYDQTTPVPVRCEIADVSFGSASNAEIQAHLNELIACLMKVWSPPVTAAGFELPRPSVTVYTNEVTTACGTAPGMNAFYCGADQQIYFADDLHRILPSQLASTPWLIETVIAHEFGHALQGRTGILIAQIAKSMDADEREKLEISRRTEVQADCFAGEFTQAISQSQDLGESDYDGIEPLMIAIGDDTLSGDPTIEGDHGHGASRVSWWRRGLGNPALSTCNTYTAPSDEVR